MKITIESTSMFTHVRGQKCRVWRGVTQDGTACDLAVALLRVASEVDTSRFQTELDELSDPDEGLVVDMRFIW